MSALRKLGIAVTATMLTGAVLSLPTTVDAKQRYGNRIHSGTYYSIPHHNEYYPLFSRYTGGYREYYPLFSRYAGGREYYPFFSRYAGGSGEYYSFFRR